MARSNLNYQLNMVINRGFRPGGNRHSNKQTGNTGTKIYSYEQNKTFTI